MNILEWLAIIIIFFIIDIFELIFELFTVGIGNVILVPLNLFIMAVFGIYLFMRGEKVITSKRALGFFGVSIIEILPFINILPGWTTYGFYSAIISLKNKKPNEAQ